MNYEIVRDKAKLEEFVEWLPNIESHERYLVCLFSRGKYSIEPDTRSTFQVRRMVCRKTEIIRDIESLEIPLGRYYFRDEPIKPRNLALYITLNPRCLRRACFRTIQDCLKNIESQNDGNAVNIANTALHRSKSKTNYVGFDIDSDNIDVEDITTKLDSILAEGSYKLLKTKGGLHILVNPKLAGRELWYQFIQNNFNIDKSGDGMIPVPGTTQGLFTPYFID